MSHRWLVCICVGLLVAAGALASAPYEDPIPGKPAAPKGESIPSAPFPPANANAAVRAAANDPPSPTVAVRVRVPAEVAPGQDLTYTLVVENLSRADAHHVHVRVPVPANAKYGSAKPDPTETEPVLMWKLGTLRGGEKKEIRLVVRPTGDGEVTCCARVQFEHGQCVKTRIARPGVEVKKVGPTEVARYALPTFKIEVRNTSKVPAKNVVVKETLPSGLDYSNSKPSTSGDNPLVWKLGDIGPGQTRVVEYQAIPSSLGAMKVNTVVEAEGGVQRESSHSLTVGEPQLSIRMMGPKQRIVGRTATYRISVRNNGSWPAKFVTLSDELPAEIEFAGASAGGKLDRDHVRWNLGTLEPGATRTVQVQVKARKAGTFKNVCTVSGDPDMKEQSKAVTEIDSPTGLALELDRGTDSLAVGESALWTLRVLNRGKVNETNVAVVVNLPEGVRAVEVRDVPQAKVADNKIILPVLPSLIAGRETAATFRLRADKVGEHTLAAEVVSDSTKGEKRIKISETVIVSGATSRTSLRPGSVARERSAFTR